MWEELPHKKEAKQPQEDSPSSNLFLMWKGHAKKKYERPFIGLP